MLVHITVYINIGLMMA